jgi:hypothetical protein
MLNWNCHKTKWCLWRDCLINLLVLPDYLVRNSIWISNSVLILKILIMLCWMVIVIESLESRSSIVLLWNFFKIRSIWQNWWACFIMKILYLLVFCLFLVIFNIILCNSWIYLLNNLPFLTLWFLRVSTNW